MSEIILYDIHSKLGNVCWNVNVWKVRATLNYKGIPYKTVFVPFTRIEETLKSAGAKPVGTWRHTGKDYYPCPCVVLPDGTALSDSLAIAIKLDELYPHKLVLRGGASVYAVLNDWIRDTFGKMSSRIMIPALIRILDTTDAEYYRASREAMLGVKFEELGPKPGSEDRKQTLDGMEAAFGKLGGMIDVGGGDKILLGGFEPNFADFFVLGFLRWSMLVLPPDEAELIRRWHDGRWVKFMDRLAPYTKKDD